jgi:ABC-type transport system involved in multi-copper enzyme maturation permease subunit
VELTMVFDVFRSDWVRLRRPAFLAGTYGAVVAVAVLATVVTFATAGGKGREPGASGPATLASLAGSAGLVHGLGSAVNLFGVVAFAAAAAHVAGDYAQGTLRNLLARQPRRAVLLGGKTLALAAFLAGAVTCATAVAVGAAFVMAQLRGVSTSAWTSSAGLAALGSTFGDVLLAVVGYGVLGIALGVTLRSPAAAIAVGVAWLLPVEALLAATAHSSRLWLPGQLLAAIAAGGTSSIGYERGVLMGLLYAAVALVTAAVVFRRRDVS